MTSTTRTSWLPLGAVSLGAFMLITDTTAVTVALPDLARGLHASLAEQQWVVNSYTLILAVLALSTGSLGDRFGQRRVFCASVALFGLASLSCALAPNIALLIAARCGQAAGGAALIVTGMSLLGTCYADRERHVAFGVLTAVVGVAGALGPILGGILTQTLTWRAIFVINVPVAALTLALTLTKIPHTPTPTISPRLDPPGMLTFAITTGTLTYALITATPTLLVISATALLVFVAIERRTPTPMLDLRLLTNRTFAATMVSVLTTSAAFAQLIYISLWLQSTQALGPIPAGLALTPMAVALFVASTHLTKRLTTWPTSRTLATGALLIAAGATLNHFLATNALTLIPGLLLTGAGLGLTGPATSTAALAAAPPDRAGMASGAMATTRQLGQTLGVAALGIAYLHGINTVYLAIAALALLTAVATRLTPPPHHE
jgi:EmrB/QacA subfamily drug resistance transporter